jgi:hypothetical protein
VNGVIAVGFPEGFEEGAPQGVVHGVALLRAVQGEASHPRPGVIDEEHRGTV